MLGAREWQEEMGQKMLPDSPHGVRAPMIGRDWEALDFQVLAALPIKKVSAIQNQSGVEGRGRSQSDWHVGGDGGEAVIKALAELNLIKTPGIGGAYWLSTATVLCVGGGAVVVGM